MPSMGFAATICAGNGRGFDAALGFDRGHGPLVRGSCAFASRLLVFCMSERCLQKHVTVENACKI